MIKKNDGFAIQQLLFSLLILIVVACIGLLINNQIKINSERNNFYAARDEVSKLGKKFAFSSSPDKQQASEYCYYTSVKFEKGDLVCQSMYQLLYKNTDQTKTKQMFDSIVLSNSDQLNLHVNDSKYLTSIGSASFAWEKPIFCGISIYYRGIGMAGVDDERSNWVMPEKSAYLQVNCLGSAKAEYFPVRS